MRLLAIGGGITVLGAIVLIVLWPSDRKKTSKSTDTSSKTEPMGKSSTAAISPNKAKEFPFLQLPKEPILVPPVAIDAGTSPVNVSHTNQAADSLVEAFQNEDRDAKVAPGREQKIGVVVKKLQEDLASPTSLSSIDCRSRHCRLELAGEIEKMMPILDAMQDERGMMGQAESMMFTRENEGIQIYLRFPESDRGREILRSLDN